MVEGKTKNSIRNTFSGVINRCINLLMPFVIRTIIIQKLGQEYLGLNSLFTSIIHVLNLSELGIGSALVFNMYKPIAEQNYPLLKGYLETYKKIYRFIGGVVLILGMVLMPFLTELIDMSALQGTNINVYLLFLIYLANTVLTYLFFAYKKSLLTAFQRQDIISKVDSIVHLVMYIVQIAVLFVFRNYYLYIIMLPVFTLIDNGVTALSVRKKYSFIESVKEMPSVDIKPLFQSIKYLIGHRIGGVIISSADSIFISAFLPMLTLTIYSNYFYVVSALTGFINVGYNAVLASIGNSVITKDKSELLELFYDLTYILFFIVSFCSACLLGLYQPFMQLWMGENYMFNTEVVILFCIYFYTWQIRVMGLVFKDAAGMWANDWLKPYIGMIVNIVLNFILIKMIGVGGVLIATIVVMVLIYFPWETVVLYRDLFKASCRKYVIRQLIYATITVITSTTMVLILRFISIGGIAGLLVKLFICAFLSATMLTLFTFRSSEFSRVLERIKTLWKRKRNI